MLVLLRFAAGVEREVPSAYWIELPTFEKTLLALEPMRRMVPTTMTRITARREGFWKKHGIARIPARFLPRK